MRQTDDLTDRQFGELTVLRRAPNDKYGKTCWVCRCSCGNECVVQTSSLKSGHRKSCGCLRHGASYNALDITGQRFGRLVAVYRTKNGNSRSVWHCVCDCGGEIDVSASSLNSGRTMSCGCLNDEKRSRMHEHMHYRDDTCVERLRRVVTDKTENKAGFRGLHMTKDGRYRAGITFRKEHYLLGYYKTYEEAVRARLDAEEQLHKGYLDALEKYKRSTETDPDREKNDPFYYTVSRVNGEFLVSTRRL